MNNLGDSSISVKEFVDIVLTAKGTVDYIIESAYSEVVGEQYVQMFTEEIQQLQTTVSSSSQACVDKNQKKMITHVLLSNKKEEPVDSINEIKENSFQSEKSSVKITECVDDSSQKGCCCTIL